MIKEEPVTTEDGKIESFTLRGLVEKISSVSVEVIVFTSQTKQDSTYLSVIVVKCVMVLLISINWNRITKLIESVGFNKSIPPAGEIKNGQIC